MTRYTPGLPSVDISVLSKNYVSPFNTTYYSAQLFLLPCDDSNPYHAIIKDDTYRVRVRRGYCYRGKNETICYKNTRLYCSMCSDKENKFYYCHVFPSINSYTSTCFMKHQHCI